MAYADQEDVLRVLGGTLDTVQTHFDRRLWGTHPLTSVTVDDNTFDVPDTILDRIEKQLVFADSRVDGYVLQQYKTRPPSIPPHLTLATAQLAAYHSLPTDGVKTEYIKDLHKETLSYLRDLSNGKLDIGVVAPRPRARAPAAIVVKGVGSGSRSLRRGCC